MRVVLALLFLIVLVNVGVRCPTPSAPLADGCQRVGAAGLTHCANQTKPTGG